METIYKYPLTFGRGSKAIEMPAVSSVLTIQMQGDTPMLWALVDDQYANTTRFINVYFTGEHIPQNPGVYIETYQQTNGLVCHAFDGGLL